MIDFQQKRKVNKFIYSKLTFVVVLVLVIFLGRATYNIYLKSRFSYDNYISVKKDYDNLNSRKNMLESEIGRLKTDSGTEEEIRSKFDVAKPGETVVIVINGSSSSSTDIYSKGGGFWSRVWGMFQ